MEEWLRILGGAVVGFFAGIATEPIKLWLAKRYKRKEVRRTLDAEMVNVAILLIEWLKEHTDSNLRDTCWGFDFHR